MCLINTSIPCRVTCLRLRTRTNFLTQFHRVKIHKQLYIIVLINYYNYNINPS